MNRVKTFLAGLSVSIAAVIPAWAQDARAGVEPPTGLARLELAGLPAQTMQYAFWGKDYAWADMALRASNAPDGARLVQGICKPLGLEMRAVTRQEGARGGSTEWTFRADQALEGVVGGGLSVKFNLAAFGAAMGEPEVLPDRKGWRWGKASGSVVDVRFDRPVASLYVEPSNRSEVRVMFFSGRVPAGESAWRMQWSVSGQEVASLGGGQDTSAWKPDPLHLGAPAIDLSALLAPRGGKGAALPRLRSRGADLVGPDGVPVRLWGTNITAHALFATSPDEIRRQARRLAALGYNLVRLHHHDSHWVQPNAWTGARWEGGRLVLSEEGLATLDRWVEALAEEGLYIWLDLHVQRAFDANDKIPSFDEIRKGRAQAEAKGFSYVNPGVQAAMRGFAEAYMSRKNRYTGQAYKDDPAVLAVLLTNENDLTIHFGNAMLADKGVPWHHQRLLQAAEAFSAQSGIAKDRLMRTWEHGPSKLFLNDLEARGHAAGRNALRGLGYQGLVVGGSTWGENPLSALPALTMGDMVDVHAYGAEGTLRRDPNFGPNLAHWIAAAQVTGMPLSVTEWNVEPFPVADRHVLPLYLAAVGAHQGWDALMHYAYTQVPPAPDRVSNWHAFNDPSLLAMMPAAALLFREQHVQPARRDFVVDLSAEQLTGKAWSPSNALALRLAMETGRLNVAMPQTEAWPWLVRRPVPAGAVPLRDLSAVPAGVSTASAVSDTGELQRDWRRGTYTIHTPRTRAALGDIGGRDIALGGVSMRWETAQLSVALQSLDGQDVEHSRDVLVSIGTRSQPQPGGRTPFMVEPAKGELSWPCPEGLRLRAAESGSTWVGRTLQRQGGRCRVVLDGREAVYWLRASSR